jgi:hypothetical protein
MRLLILLASTTMLAACGGAGPQSAGSSAPPTGSGNGGGGNTVHTFIDPTEPKTYTAVGATHSYQYSVEDPGGPGALQTDQLYQGNATTVRNSNMTIAYNPRDAIFDVKFSNSLAGTTTASRFQDPLHRTNFGGLVEPQIGTPNLAAPAFGIQGMNYLEAVSSNNVASGISGQFSFDLIDPGQGGSYDATTFFYQTPGTETEYVTFAGYLRNTGTVSNVTIDNPSGPATTFLRQNNKLERGAFAYGQITPNDQVPTTGTGSFEGTMLASMVFNDQPDTLGNFDTYFQWIAGRATTNVDFGANIFSLSLDGTVGAPFLDGTSGQHTILENAKFYANGGGDINLVSAGGFFGQFNEAWFINSDANKTRLDMVIAGSSIDGAFYGPNGGELGGGFRIVGGTPDERIDILGTFVGKRP